MRTFQIFHLSGASRYLLSHAVGLYALESRIQALCLTPAEAVVMARLLYLEMSRLLLQCWHRRRCAGRLCRLPSRVGSVTSMRPSLLSHLSRLFPSCECRTAANEEKSP